MSRLPRGFLLSAAGAAIKRPGRNDMALIFSEANAAAAGTFTTNRIKAAPVRLDMRRIRSGRGRAVVVNSGNANACTGKRGMLDAEETASLAAGHLGIPDKLVYVCSTGVIGVPLPMRRMRPALKTLAKGLGSASLEDAARAIMTTDTVPKFLSTKIRVGLREGIISAICKGAGMIDPSMATMLSFIMTDVAVEGKAFALALREAVDGSFNSITIDGDRSTNDTVLLLANGMLGNSPLREGSADFRRFKAALSGVTGKLAEMIARDGEGATRLVEVEVMGARTEAEARRGAKAVANSLLVKTALYGGDPNWGRVMAVLGASGISIKEEKTDVFFGRVKVAGRGAATGKEQEARKELKGREVRIRAALNIGRARARVLTCDLTEEYVRINAEYTT